jgi:hypothetical protein
MAANGQPQFTISTEAKMDMSLDEIVKADRKTTQKKQRPVGKNATMRTNASTNRRRNQLVQASAQRSSTLRQQRVDKMRGIESTNSNNNTNTNRKFRVQSTNARFTSPRTSNRRVQASAATWSAQQRQRSQNQRKKLAQAQQNTSNDNSNVKISIRTSNFNARGRGTRGTSRVRVARGGRGRLSIKTSTFADRGARRGTALAQSRRSTQNARDVTVNSRRGITVSSDSKTLHERFSSQPSRGRGRGRGSRGGFRGGFRGGRGGRGGRGTQRRITVT